MPNIKTRFPPSPTGSLHIGNLRTALFDYLYAKKHGGTFMLRIEDTDRERLIEGGVENIINTLKTFHLTPDEGPFLDDNGEIYEKGELGPYIQSKRLDIYKEHIQKLLDTDNAYYCFCSKERLDELRKVQQLNKQATGYDGHCRELDMIEAKQRIDVGESHVIRLKVPKEGQTSFSDLVRGDVTFENKLIDDQVLIKADGYPTYHFAVVVDDRLMEATHVARGEEWVSSTPKHVLIYEAFGWELPIFAHLPLLVNEKKQKLSKRHGDVSVQDFLEKGYLVEAITNFVAFLGWNPGDDRTIMSLDELAKEFDFENVQKAAAVFDREKLDWYNKQYIMNMSAGELAERAALFFPEEHRANTGYLTQVVKLEQGRAHTLAEIVENTAFMFVDKLVYEKGLLTWKKSTPEDAAAKLQAIHDFWSDYAGTWEEKALEEATFAWMKEQEFGTGDVLWPTRVALSGQKNSPGPFEIASVLGKDASLERIQHALS